MGACGVQVLCGFCLVIIYGVFDWFRNLSVSTVET